MPTMNDHMPADENAIIKQCLDGDAEKYSILVERYKSMVYNVACRMLGDADAANDAAQESFLSAYRGLKGFKYGAKFSSWLYRIVMNKCRDYLRTGKDTVPVDEIAEVRAEKRASPEEAASTRQTGDAVQAALNALAEEERELIVLKHIEELDYKEISDILGVGIPALKVRAHRGREKLKRLLEEMGVGRNE